MAKVTQVGSDGTRRPQHPSCSLYTFHLTILFSDVLGGLISLLAVPSGTFLPVHLTLCSSELLPRTLCSPSGNHWPGTSLSSWLGTCRGINLSLKSAQGRNEVTDPRRFWLPTLTLSPPVLAKSDSPACCPALLGWGAYFFSLPSPSPWKSDH